MPPVDTLHALLVAGLRQLYHAEQELAKVLPRLAKAARTDDVHQAFIHHHEETRRQVQRVKKCFAVLRIKLRARTSPAALGLVDESAQVAGMRGPVPVRDTGLLGVARRIEHYEIGAYEDLLALATALGERTVADLLHTTLDEKHAAAEIFGVLAMNISQHLAPEPPPDDFGAQGAPGGK